MQYLRDLAGGFSFLLLGMELLSKGVAGVMRPRRLSAAGGFLCGLGWTAAAQSSSAVSAMLISMAGTGVLDTADCFPVLLGANLGTTVTAWLFCVMRLRAVRGIGLLPAVAALLLRKKPALSRMGLGLSLVLTGMALMQAAAQPLHTLALRLTRADAAFWSSLCLTALWQSSAATVGMLQEMPDLSLRLAAAAVIGANIGTCTTALLASLRQPHCGVALQQIGINLFGALLFLPALRLLPAVPATPLRVAAFHSLFNAATAALLLAGFVLFRRARNKDCNLREKMV